MNVHVHIDHLVIDRLPVDPAAGDQLQAGIEAELARLLAAGALGPGLRAGGLRLATPAEDIALSNGDTPNSLGRKIGRAVYRGISR
jgi:hypothetical protein